MRRREGSFGWVKTTLTLCGDAWTATLTTFEALVWRRPERLARDLVSDDLGRGLYTEPFGPRFYGGFTSASQPSFVELTAPPPAPSRVPAYVAFGVAAASVIGAATAGAVAWDAYGDYNATHLERQASAHRERYKEARLALWLSAGTGLVSAALGAWLW